MRRALKRGRCESWGVMGSGFARRLELRRHRIRGGVCGVIWIPVARCFAWFDYIFLLGRASHSPRLRPLHRSTLRPLPDSLGGGIHPMKRIRTFSLVLALCAAASVPVYADKKDDRPGR